MNWNKRKRKKDKTGKKTRSEHGDPRKMSHLFSLSPTLPQSLRSRGCRSGYTRKNASYAETTQTQIGDAPQRGAWITARERGLQEKSHWKSGIIGSKSPILIPLDCHEMKCTKNTQEINTKWFHTSKRKNFMCLRMISCHSVLTRFSTKKIILSKKKVGILFWISICWVNQMNLFPEKPWYKRCVLAQVGENRLTRTVFIDFQKMSFFRFS